MGNFPTLHDDEFYALMNAHDGKFLHYKSNISDFDMSNPKHPSAGNNVADYIFLPKKLHTSTLTITLEVEGSNNIALDKPNNSIEATNPTGGNTKKQQWVVSVGHSGIYNHFYTLTNEFHKTVLSRDLNQGWIVGSKPRNFHRAQWQFVHIPKGLLPGQDFAKIHTSQQRFLDDKQEDEDKEEEDDRDLTQTLQDLQETGGGPEFDSRLHQRMGIDHVRVQPRPAPTGPQPYTGPNLCGNPTCGIDHICAADYNRIVRPMGYPGVPGF